MEGIRETLAPRTSVRVNKALGDHNLILYHHYMGQTTLETKIGHLYLISRFENSDSKGGSSSGFAEEGITRVRLTEMLTNYARKRQRCHGV